MSTFATFLGLIGTSAIAANYFLTSWQQRNWFNQQQFASAAKDFAKLTELFEDITILSSRRHARMLRLASVLQLQDHVFQEALENYKQSVIEWNDKLPGFLASLTMYVNFQVARRLEDEIQNGFYVLGAHLENLSRLRIFGLYPSRRQASSLTLKLNKLGGLLRNFHKRLLRIQGEQQEITYHGTLLSYSEFNLERFSSLYLLKALFISDIEKLRIVRSSPNLFGPLVRRGHGPGVNEKGRY